MAGHGPTMAVLIQEMINHAAADVADPEGILSNVLATYGLSIDTSLSTDDEGELVGLRFGDRRALPDGVSICFVPLETEETPIAAPSEDQEWRYVWIRPRWRDTPADDKLTRTQGRMWRFMALFCDALRELYCSAALPGDCSSWELPGGLLHMPRCRATDYGSYDEEVMHQVGLDASLEFSGYCMVEAP